MAKQLRSEEALQSALLRFGDAAFRICYMHTKKPRDAQDLLEDIFMQYCQNTQRFENEADERFWVLRTTHQVCMDYYASKMRKKLTAAQIRRYGKDLPFAVSNELCAILKLSYPYQTMLALCFGEEDTLRFASRVTGKPAALLRRRAEKAPGLTGLSPEDMREWIQTIVMPDDMRSRVQYAILNQIKDKHFGVNSRAKSLKRGLDRAIPYIALGVIVIGVFSVVAVRAGWFGTPYVRTPDVTLVEDTPASESSGSTESHAATPVPESSADESRTAAILDVSVFVPSESGLTQYNYTGLEADAQVIVQKMAEKGAFPADVTLDDLTYMRNGEPVSALRSGEQLEVRLQFSGTLQNYLDGAASTASLEAIAKTFRAFYEAADMTLAKLEIYSGGQPVVVGGMEINCTSLMYGELPVSDVIDEP
ncbi:MAG: sigma-70 family RNA polymerase sigma factor [Hominenteromicrobium sp.]